MKSLKNEHHCFGERSGTAQWRGVVCVREYHQYMGEEQKNPKFSEAIRLGAMLGPQTFGAFSTVFGLFRRRKATCAVGAALEAFPCRYVTGASVPVLGFRSDGPVQYGRLLEVPGDWSAVMWKQVQCPACEDFQVFGPLFRIVAMHLNDKHRWSREHIADFVEGVERSLGIYPSEIDQAQTDARPELEPSDPEAKEVGV